MSASPASPLRCSLVWLVTTAAAVLAGSALRAEALALAGSSDADLATVLVRVASAVLLLCAAWAWLVTTTVVVEAALGLVRPARGVPAGWRRLVLLACGAGLAVGLAGPAAAEPGLAGLPLPDRALGGPAPTAVVPVVPVVVGPATATVQPGDSLWTLAERRLGADASPAQVDRQWRRLYRLNRSVVGPDPDLIRPGQRLRLPPPPQEP